MQGHYVIPIESESVPDLVYKQSLFKLVKKGSDLDIVSIDIICDFNATEDTSLNLKNFMQ